MKIKMQKLQRQLRWAVRGKHVKMLNAASKIEDVGVGGKDADLSERAWTWTKKKGCAKIFEEITVETFSNMGKEIATQVQEAQRVPYRDKFKEKLAKIRINQANKN